MRFFLYLHCVFLLFLFACKKPAEKTTAPITAEKTRYTDCPDYFYYYQQEKIALTLKPDIILAGFQPNLDTDAKTKLLKTIPEYEAISEEQTGSTGPFHIITLRNTTTCLRTLEIMKQLQQKPEITFANPAFAPGANLGGEYTWMGLTPGILVTLKSPEQLPQLQTLLTETRTQLADELGPGTYLINVPKNAKGTALEMANYFHEQPFISNAEPDFYLATNSNSADVPKR